MADYSAEDQATLDHLYGASDSDSDYDSDGNGNSRGLGAKRSIADSSGTTNDPDSPALNVQTQGFDSTDSAGASTPADVPSQSSEAAGTTQGEAVSSNSNDGPTNLVSSPLSPVLSDSALSDSVFSDSTSPSDVASSNEDSNSKPTQILCQGDCKSFHPPSEIIYCNAQHPFCKDDASAYTTTKLGSGVLSLKCLNDDCAEILPGSEVLKYIDLKIFLGRPKAILERMIGIVGATGLVEICPRPNPNRKTDEDSETCNAVNNTGPLEDGSETFTCYFCGESSCRKCQKEVHGSLDCDQASKVVFSCINPTCQRNDTISDLFRWVDGLPVWRVETEKPVKSPAGEYSMKCYNPDCTNTNNPFFAISSLVDIRGFDEFSEEKVKSMLESLGLGDSYEVCKNCSAVNLTGPAKVDDSGNTAYTCRKCKKSNCRKCKEPAHGSETCPADSIPDTSGTEIAPGPHLKCTQCQRVYLPNNLVGPGPNSSDPNSLKWFLVTSSSSSARETGDATTLRCANHPNCEGVFPILDVVKTAYGDSKLFGKEGTHAICPRSFTAFKCEGEGGIASCTDQNCLLRFCRECKNDAETCSGNPCQYSNDYLSQTDASTSALNSLADNRTTGPFHLLEAQITREVEEMVTIALRDALGEHFDVGLNASPPRDPLPHQEPPPPEDTNDDDPDEPHSTLHHCPSCRCGLHGQQSSRPASLTTTITAASALRAQTVTLDSLIPRTPPTQRLQPPAVDPVLLLPPPLALGPPPAPSASQTGTAGLPPTSIPGKNFRSSEGKKRKPLPRLGFFNSRLPLLPTSLDDSTTTTIDPVTGLPTVTTAARASLPGFGLNGLPRPNISKILEAQMAKSKARGRTEVLDIPILIGLLVVLICLLPGCLQGGCAAPGLRGKQGLNLGIY